MDAQSEVEMEGQGVGMKRAVAILLCLAGLLAASTPTRFSGVFDLGAGSQVW
jgi:hypothetical protein